MARKKSQKKETKTISIKVEWIAVGLFVILLVLSIFTRGFTKLPFNLKSPLSNILGSETMSKEDAKERVTRYINEVLLQGQTVAEVSDLEDDLESDDLYKFTITIQDQQFDSYMSRDGKYLYTERMEIELEDDEGEAPVADYPKQDTPDVLLFTMTYCPYGNQAEDFVQPVYSLLGNSVNFEPHYVIYSSAQGYEGAEYCLDSENKYCSMHGIGELNQGVRELCTWKYQKDKFWDFVMAVNTQCDSSNVDQCWEQVARDSGVETEQIKTCQANEAETLLAEEVRLNEQYGVTGSPAIIVNGMDYAGARAPEDFKKAVCAGFNTEPGECSQTLEESGTATEGSCE
ncbi:DsbA family protein [Patescibacteria group bacterium]